MRIDTQYMSELLNKMLDAKTPTFTLWDLADIATFMRTRVENKIEERDLFVFHMEVLYDDQLITSASRNYVGIGISRQKDGSYVYSTNPLRLTAAGHRYADNLFLKPSAPQSLASWRYGV